MALKAMKPADLAAKVAADVSSGDKQTSAVGSQQPAVDETAQSPPPTADLPTAAPARSMANDLKDIAGAAGAKPPDAADFLRMLFVNMERDADNHPQGRQGCMLFDPPVKLPDDFAQLLPDGVWRRDADALWQIFIEDGAFVKMIRADMIHLREPLENVRELAA